MIACCVCVPRCGDVGVVMLRAVCDISMSAWSEDGVHDRAHVRVTHEMVCVHGIVCVLLIVWTVHLCVYVCVCVRVCVCVLFVPRIHIVPPVTGTVAFQKCLG